jgi:hypothetical protein
MARQAELFEKPRAKSMPWTVIAQGDLVSVVERNGVYKARCYLAPKGVTRLQYKTITKEDALALIKAATCNDEIDKGDLDFFAFDSGLIPQERDFHARN